VLIRHHARRIHDRNAAEVTIARENRAETTNSAGRAPSAASAATNAAPIAAAPAYVQRAALSHG
jgi:hypothetical protein